MASIASVTSRLPTRSQDMPTSRDRVAPLLSHHADLAISTGTCPAGPDLAFPRTRPLVQFMTSKPSSPPGESPVQNMTLAERLAAGRFVITAEVVPPVSCDRDD